jgi:hypothetical protein
VPVVSEVAMNRESATLIPVIHLDSNQADGRVVVYDHDKVFLLTVHEAVKACGMLDKAAAILDQMKALTQKLTTWLTDRRERVRSATLSVKPGGLHFLVVTRGREFDQVLEDDLTDLDIELANSSEYDLLRVNVLALPNVPSESVEAFI